MFSTHLSRSTGGLVLNPACRLFVRHRGVAGWRRDPNSTDARIDRMKRKFYSPIIHRFFDIVSVLRIGSLSFYDDIRRVTSAKYHNRISRPFRDDLSTKDRSDVLAIHRVLLTLRQCCLPVFTFNIPTLGYVFAFFILRSPTKYLTPYFWTNDEETQFSKNNFPTRKVFYQEVVGQVLASELISAKDKLAVKKVLDGDLSSVGSLAEVFALKFPLHSLPQEHVISLCRSWNLWKVFPEERTYLPTWLNRGQLQRHLRLVAQNDTSVSWTGVKRLAPDDLQYCWVQRGFPERSRKEMPALLEKSASFSSLSEEMSVSAHLNVIMALGLASRKAKL